MNPGCKATAHRSLISAALAVLPAVMPNKANPNAIVAETLRMLRRFILSHPTCISVGCQWFAPSRSATRPAARQRSQPDAENSGGEVSLLPHRREQLQITKQYHAADDRSVANSTLARRRNGLLLLLQVRAAESGPFSAAPLVNLRVWYRGHSYRARSLTRRRVRREVADIEHGPEQR
jgi:hypothetical protein